VNIILNLIAYFSQNEVPLLLLLYHVDDVTITTKVSKCSDITMSLWRHCIITNHFWQEKL